MTKVIVDTDRNFTPFRVLRKTRSYTDHFSYKIVVKMPSAKAEFKEKETVWNLRKPGGWEAYKVKTDELADKLEQLVDDEEVSIEKVMSNVIKLENKAKFSSFGKTRKQGCFKTKSNMSIKNCGNKNQYRRKSKCLPSEESISKDRK